MGDKREDIWEDKWEVNEWGSHPDKGNDDCNTGVDYTSEESARTAFEVWRAEFDAVPESEHNSSSDVQFIVLHKPGGEVVEVIRDPRGSDEMAKAQDERDARQWKQEIALEAGMLHGVDAYNDAMGFS